MRTTFAIEIFSSVVKKTPVDTGRARGNWTVSKGSKETGETNRTDKKKYGSSSAYENTEKKKLGSLNGDESIYIQNNLPYIKALEYGHSKQAANGMVGVTLANAEMYWKNAIAIVKAKGGKDDGN